MKIAVFARSLGAQSTGRGSYVRELLLALSAGPTPPEVYLFSGEDVGIPGCRFYPARGSGSLSDAWRIFRGIAADVRGIEPELFWGTTHFFPRGLPSGLPKVATVLDLVWKDHPRTLGRWRRWGGRFMEQGLLQADRIVCISEFTRSRLLHHWPEMAARSSVIPLAANPRLRRPEDARVLLRTLPEVAEPFVINVDTFEPRKNLSLLLSAMERLKGVTFVHCGHIGWSSSEVVERAHSMPNVRLLGYVDEATLGALYSRAAAAVFPSIYEGFHLPPLDAASLGTPVLASDIPVHREVLGDAALYFRIDDPDGLADQIRQVVASPALRERMARAGESRARAYRWQESGRQLLGVFESLLRSEGGRGD